MSARCLWLFKLRDGIAPGLAVIPANWPVGGYGDTFFAGRADAATFWRVDPDELVYIARDSPPNAAPWGMR